jgi:8-oxo-dGTP diphosphatase
MRTISVAFLCLLAPDCGDPQAADDAADARWCPVQDVPKLAFDHDDILAAALDHLRARLENSDVVYHLLPEKFTLTELQTAHELILGQILDKRNFRRKLLQSGRLSEVGQRRGKEGRPARLYRYSG